jgi:hypothetical protein
MPSMKSLLIMGAVAIVAVAIAKKTPVLQQYV